MKGHLESLSYLDSMSVAVGKITKPSKEDSPLGMQIFLGILAF